MGAIELSLAWIFGVALGWLAAVGRERVPAWGELLAAGAAAWVCGVQALLFRRHIDYMLGYLFEGRGHERFLYPTWCAASTLLAYAGSVQIQRRKAGRSPRWPLWIGLALALMAAPLWLRLREIGSTLEFKEGIARPLAWQPAVGTLLTFTAIGALIPLAGTLLLVGFDGLRARRQVPPSPPVN